ncbi:MAG: hypothetical protein ACXVPQ_05760 [Bacteroidia bacterium]
MNKKLILIIIFAVVAGWAISLAVYMLIYNGRRNEAVEYKEQARAKLQKEQQMFQQADTLRDKAH